VNAPVPAQTSRAPPGPHACQISVFLEARCERVLALVRLFESGGIHILGISLVDATDSCMARLVVDDPDEAARMLAAACVPFTRARLLVVELADVAAGVSGVFAALLSAEVNAHYSYPLLCRPNGRPLLALCVEDNDMAEEALRRQGIPVLRQADLAR
jgi:hypothetical protein